MKTVSSTSVSAGEAPPRTAEEAASAAVQQWPFPRRKACSQGRGPAQVPSSFSREEFGKQVKSLVSFLEGIFKQLRKTNGF